MTIPDFPNVEEYLVVETAARFIITEHMETLRLGITNHDPDLLKEALSSLEKRLSEFPEQYMSFLVVEAIMMLAANTQGELLVGVGEVSD